MVCMHFFRPLPRLLLYFLLTLVCSSGCATTETSRSSGPVSDPVLAARPGRVAWSPDSRRLALASEGGILLLQAEGGGKKPVQIDMVPTFLQWAPAEDLLLVAAADGARGLYRVNPVTFKAESIALSREPTAAWWFREGTSVVVFHAEMDPRSIGTFGRFSLGWMEGAAETERASLQTYFPVRRTTADLLNGWISGGLRPFHETFLTPEFHDPPALPAYTVLRTVDPVTGESEDLGRLAVPSMQASYSWSFAGDWLAVVDDAGSLQLFHVSGGGPIRIETKLRGRFATWHPFAEVIYFGGALLTAEGEMVERLTEDGGNSLGVWSPDGRKIAVLSGGTVSIFTPSFSAGNPESPKPPSSAQDEEALGRYRLLKDLYADKLITREEFQTRRGTLLERAGRGGR